MPATFRTQSLKVSGNGQYLLQIKPFPSVAKSRLSGSLRATTGNLSNPLLKPVAFALHAFADGGLSLVWLLG